MVSKLSLGGTEFVCAGIADGGAQTVVSRGWSSVAPDERRQLREFVFTYISENFKNLAPFVCTKVGL